MHLSRVGIGDVSGEVVAWCGRGAEDGRTAGRTSSHRAHLAAARIQVKSSGTFTAARAVEHVAAGAVGDGGTGYAGTGRKGIEVKSIWAVLAIAGGVTGEDEFAKVSGIVEVIVEVAGSTICIGGVEGNAVGY